MSQALSPCPTCVLPAAEERKCNPQSLACELCWLPRCEDFLAALRMLGLLDGVGEALCTPVAPSEGVAGSPAMLCVELLLKALPLALRAQVSGVTGTGIGASSIFSAARTEA